MLQDLLIIIALQLVYVPIYTMGMLFMVKGYTHISSILSIFEVLIYVYGLSIVLQGEQPFIAMMVYAVANGVGLEIGAYLESKLAIGYLAIEVLINQKDDELVKELKEDGYKVTAYDVKGKDNQMYRLDILTKRNREKEVEKLVMDYQPSAVMVMYEPYDIKGRNPVRKRRKRFAN